MRFVTGLFAAAMLLIAGCAHVQQEPEGYSVSQFWSTQASQAGLLDKVSGKLFLSYRSGGQHGSGKGQMIADIPERMRLELRDSFGRLHFLAVLNRATFSAHYPRQNKFYEDTNAGRQYLKQMAGFDRSFDKLLPLLFGTLPKELGSRFHSWRWDGRKGLYRGVIKDREMNWDVYVDPSRSTIARIEGESPFSRFVLEYDRFERCCGGSSIGKNSGQMFLAKSVSLKESGTRHNISFEWQDVNWVKGPFPERAFQFRPSPGDTKIQ